MDAFTVSAEAVSERIQAMRISAELSLSRVQTYAETHASELAKVVAGYRTLLSDTGVRLVRAQVAVTRGLAAKPGDPTLTALLRKTIELLTAWTAHAKGYGAYERPATDAEKGQAVAVGWAGVVIALAIAGAVIAVSFTGIAWAVVHYKEAQTLSDEVALIERDPSIAPALAQVNSTAPSSAPPDPTNPGGGSGGGGWVWLLAAAGLAGAAIYFAPKLGKG